MSDSNLPLGDTGTTTGVRITHPSAPVSRIGASLGHIVLLTLGVLVHPLTLAPMP